MIRVGLIRLGLIGLGLIRLGLIRLGLIRLGYICYTSFPSNWKVCEWIYRPFLTGRFLWDNQTKTYFDVFISNQQLKRSWLARSSCSCRCFSSSSSFEFAGNGWRRGGGKTQSSPQPILGQSSSAMVNNINIE